MREIIIDEDTRVYYVYEEKLFYIENKETSTPRATAEEAFKVLKIVAGENPVDIDGNPITADRLNSELAETFEILENLYYTWDDKGAYIKTIQLNSFKEHPIAIDCEKAKIYIMNTEYVFDLTLTEGRKNRLEIMQLYYKDTLGLELTLQQLEDLYVLLVDYYSNPTPYNVIATPVGTPANQRRYGSYIQLSNYRNVSPAVYNVERNPKNQFTYDNVVGHIIQGENNIVTLSATAPSSIHVGQELVIENADTVVDTTTYTANGTYIVQSVSDNKVYMTENLSSPYLYEPVTVSIVAYKNSITSASRDDNTITVHDNPSSYLVGDKIAIHGTVIQTEYETLTLDGTYTITSISGKDITVSEPILTDYTTPSGATPYIYKAIFANNVNTIENNSITVEGDLSPKIVVVNPPQEIVIHYPDTDTLEYTTVTGIGTSLITTGSTLTPSTPNYASLIKPEPYPEMLITVDYTNNSNIFPTGQFMVDNSEQLESYLELLPNLTLTNSNNYALLNELVPTSMYLDEEDYPYLYLLNPMSLLGLYSEIYTEE